MTEPRVSAIACNGCVGNVGSAAQVIRNRGVENLSAVGRIVDVKDNACGNGLTGTGNSLVKSPRNQEEGWRGRGGRMVFKPGLQPTLEDKLLLQRMSKAYAGRGFRVLEATTPIESTPTPLPEANAKAIEQTSPADPFLSPQKPSL